MMSPFARTSLFTILSPSNNWSSPHVLMTSRCTLNKPFCLFGDQAAAQHPGSCRCSMGSRACPPVTCPEFYLFIFSRLFLKTVFTSLGVWRSSVIEVSVEETD